MADAASDSMRAIAIIAALGDLGPSGCILSGDDPCEATAEEVFATTVLTQASGQAYLTTPAANKDCHAVFTARLAYTGDDAFDPSLPQPLVDVSANAVGTGGEQPGLIGILTEWRRIEDPDNGEITWWAEIDGAAKNVDAPAVNYGLAGVRQPGETLAVDYYAQITYRPPPADVSTRLVPGARSACR